MNSLCLALLAAFGAAGSSFFFRKNNDNCDKNHSANGYLVLFFFCSFIFSFLLFPELWKFNVNYIVLSVGICVGVLCSTVMIFTASALKFGPAGLTYAFQNASAVFPGLLLFLFLGSDFGFSCSPLQLLGMIIVLLGLYLGAKKESNNQQKTSSSWLKYALICFIVQILALTFIQARCILFDCDHLTGIFSNFAVTETDDIWFLPGQFGTCLILQSILFLKEKRNFQQKEIINGCCGGIANFFSSYMLLLATKYATPFEKGILFPCFAVAAMILCNLWACRFYQEKFNYQTNALCSIGIFLAVAG